MPRRNYFRVTYEIITPESAEHGDADSRGFASPGGWRHDDPVEMSLREAIDIAGSCLENSGSWLSSIDADENYATGESTFYSVHPPHTITPASYARLVRLTCR